MSADSDPRVFFAAERTLLAWVRTGLAVIGLGFVVSRFGLFLRIMRPAGVPPGTFAGSTVIGLALVLFGSAAIGVAGWQHLRFCRDLPPADRPGLSRIAGPTGFALVLAMVGLTLAFYILVSSPSPSLPER
jgi:putative membrane protein